MKLSPTKVEQIVDDLIDVLAETEGVLFQGNDAQLKLGMSDIFTDELTVEDRLDSEVHSLLQAYKYEITTERLSYDDLFKKTKQRLINERKLVL